MHTLTLSDVTVRQDAEGRFCLNDLHKAAGSEAKHQPALFMRLDQTKALIEEISSTDSQIIPTKTVTGKGKSQGTYVCRELVYAYATWISPAFYLKVLRTFDSVATAAPYGIQQLPEPKTKKALPGCLTLEQQDAIKALVKSRVEDLPKDKQAGAAIKLWSSIKTKYGCGYKEVPADQFSAVLSLISRVSLESKRIAGGPVPAIYHFPKPKEGDKSPYSDLMMALLQQLQANHNDVSGAMEIWRNLVDRNERIMESLFGIMAELTLCTKPGRGFMDNHIARPDWHQGFIDGRKRALN